jgi:hypothetical protein
MRGKGVTTGAAFIEGPARWLPGSKESTGNRRIVGTLPEARRQRKQVTMIVVSTPLDADTLRIRHEFLAMPGLCLAVPQAARLLGVSSSHAAEMLAVLEEEDFLVHTPDGQYRRAEPLLA